MKMAFIDARREELGIEPICQELAVAPSSYHQHAARLADPGKRSARARHDDELKEHIRRVHEDSFGLYGSRKVWRQLLRDGVTIAKCTVEPHESPHSNDPESPFEELIVAEEFFELQDERA